MTAIIAKNMAKLFAKAAGSITDGGPAYVSGPTISYSGSNFSEVASDGTGIYDEQSYTIAGFFDLTGASALWSYDALSHAGLYYAQHLRVEASGKIYFGWNDGTSFQFLDNIQGGIFTGEHHIAITFTSGSQKIYYDGTSVASGTRTDTITYYAQEVWVGKNNFQTTAAMDVRDLRMYARALTAGEIEWLANEGASGTPIAGSPLYSHESL